MNDSKNLIDIEIIISKHSQKAPVKLTPILEELGIDLYLATFSNTKKSGEIIKNKDRYEILVNKENPFTRQRFTTAHELAHFMLHRSEIDKRKRSLARHSSDYTPKDVPKKDYFLYRAQEQEANKKAADILMPLSLIADNLKKVEKDTKDEEKIIKRMAEMFEVSFEAMAMRLEKPEYIYK